MDVLFVISIGCFFALFFTALAVARHLRIEAARGTRPREDHMLRDPQDPAPRGSEPEPSRSPQQTLHTLAQRKQPDWRFLVAQDAHRPHPAGSISPMMRKPPTSIRAGRTTRTDWAHFNKDLGDLSDPYQPPKARSTGTHQRR